MNIWRTSMFALLLVYWFLSCLASYQIIWLSGHVIIQLPWLREIKRPTFHQSQTLTYLFAYQTKIDQKRIFLEKQRRFRRSFLFPDVFCVSNQAICSFLIGVSAKCDRQFRLEMGGLFHFRSRWSNPIYIVHFLCSGLERKHA